MRVVRGVISALTLLMFMAGAPVVLCLVGQAKQLARIDWTRIWVERDDGSLLLGLMTVIAWAAWFMFTVSVIAETIDAVRRIRLPAARTLQLPGLELTRSLVRGLVASVIALLVGLSLQRQAPAPAAPQAVASATPTTDETESIETVIGRNAALSGQEPVKPNEITEIPERPVPPIPPDAMASQPETAPQPDTAPRPVTVASAPAAAPHPVTVASAPAAAPAPRQSLYVVQPGDDLWTLAQRVYGEGTQWRRIVEANPDLLSGPDELVPGTRLVLPGVPAADGSSVVVVKRGDTLWQLARTYLGSGEQWPQIYAANRDLIKDPDHIDIGWRLVIPPTPPTATPPQPTQPTQPQPTQPQPTQPRPSQPGPSQSPSITPSATPTPSVPAVPATASATPQTTSTPSSTPQPAATSTSTPAGQATPAADHGTAGNPTNPSPDPTPKTPLWTGLIDIGARRSLAALLIGAIGVGTSTALLRTLRHRRDLQLAKRPLGRRIPHPEPPVQRFEQALGITSHSPNEEPQITVIRADPTTLARTAPDRARNAEPRAISVVHAGEPYLSQAALQATILRPAGPEPPPPPEESPPPENAKPLSPAVITVGVSDEQSWHIDLEEVGQLTVELDEGAAAWGAVTAICLELALGPTPEEPLAQVIAVGRVGEVLDRAGLDPITTIADPDQALDELEQTITEQRAELDRHGWSLSDTRADPDARDAWWPRVYVFPPLTDQQLARIADAIGTGPRTAVSAIVVGGSAVDFAAAAPARALGLGTTPLAAVHPRRRVAPQIGAWLVGNATEARLAPYEVTIPPVGLTSAGITAITTLLETTGRCDTTPAAWYPPAEHTTANVRPLRPRFPGPVKEVADMGSSTGPGVTDFAYPTLLLLGPIRLVGTAGTPPVRAERACIEYCAWLLEHPGTTASEMATALLVAESTRRSNLSRLRSWLGHNSDGAPYLPDGYSGHLFLDPCVSSDWHRLQMLVAPGITRASTETLTNALHLVRGAPLADAAPGQWHWAEELRTDMSSLVRDIGALVAQRSLESGDYQTARWATARALLAAPDDELLIRWRIQAEHLAGNRAEVERLVLRVTRHARRLGVDLDDETIAVIQESIEGRPRARA